MHNPFTSFESRLKLYRRAWLVAVVLTLILRFTVFLRSPEHDRFYVFLAFALGTWLPVLILNGIESYRLKSYFAARHGSRREFLLGFKLFAWFFSSHNYGDSHLDVLKQDRQRFGRFAVIVFFTYPVMFFICVV